MVKNPKLPKRPRDVSQLAKHIVDITTGEQTTKPKPRPCSKNGQRRVGPLGAEKLTAEERSAIAKKAARARWQDEA